MTSGGDIVKKDKDPIGFSAGLSQDNNYNTLIANLGEGYKEEEIDVFAQMIKDGKTVIFPTETVYGLGADGLNEDAAEKIYKAKGRPSDNPLILHIADLAMVDQLCKDIPQKARKLMEKFMPGPITLVLKKSSIVPYKTSGGLDTVGIRMPSNPIANLLIKKAERPIAAPSANISGRPSPTSPDHVINEMYGRVDGIITRGRSDFGIESTIVDFTEDIPTILRPGAITIGMIREVIGEVIYDKALDQSQMINDDNVVAKAPGMKYTHYSPKADVCIVKGTDKELKEWLNNKLEQNEKLGIKTAIMCIEKNKDNYQSNAFSLGINNLEVAKNLFQMMIDLDEMGYQQIYSEDFTDEGIGVAIMNRLLKSAAYNIKYLH